MTTAVRASGDAAAAGEAARTEVVRFGLWHRSTHGVLALSVFGLVFTGMPLKYAGTLWSRPLMALWGGPHAAGVFHRAFAVGFFVSGAMHLGWLAAAAVGRRLPRLFDPDSILPRRDDVRHAAEYLRFLRGRGARPAFGRFTYWEKFDYFAEIWGLLVIGLSGLVMWFPERAARYLPGWVVNAALIFHSYEALLAMGFLFAIHFFNTHLRPEVFPVDRVIFSGRLPLDEVAERYPGWYRRLAEGVRLPAVPSTRRASRVPAVVSGVFVVLGLVMLVLVMSSAVAQVARLLVRALP